MHPSTQQLTDALAIALDQYPDERPTILRGFTLALYGAVTLEKNGLHHVASVSHPGEYYHTTLCACACRAVSKSPGGRCKHRYAVALMVRATQESLKTIVQQIVDPVTTASLAAQICDPDSRVARELAGFSGPTARHK